MFTIFFLSGQYGGSVGVWMKTSGCILYLWEGKKKEEEEIRNEN